MLHRRDFLKRIALAGGGALAAPMIGRNQFRLFAAEYSKRAVELVEESLVIDMLGLLTLDWSRLARWKREPGAFRPADYQKLKSSGITVFHPAVDLDSRTAEDAFRATSHWLKDWNVFFDSYPRELLRVDKAADLVRAKSQGRIGVVLGFQNADHFRTVEDIPLFYSKGQRISQLTYNEPNLVGAGCTSPRDTGLTEYGATVIETMNRVGMAVDASHSSDCTTMEAIRLSRKPVLISHSNCRALNERRPRCKPDSVIREMAARGGVMGITGIRGFVRAAEPATIEDVLDHFDHVARLVGVEHVGVGSDNDLDGRDRSRPRIRMDIERLAHPRRIYDLTEGLIRRRHSNDSIRLILGGNFQRALAAIWG
jgi:membrane dipeptidase